MVKNFVFPAADEPIDALTIWNVFEKSFETETEIPADDIADFFSAATSWCLFHNAIVDDPTSFVDSQYYFCCKFFDRFKDSESLLRQLCPRTELAVIVGSAYSSASTLYNNNEFISLLDDLSAKYGLCVPGHENFKKALDSFIDSLPDMDRALIQIHDDILTMLVDAKIPFSMFSLRRSEYEQDNTIYASDVNDFSPDNKLETSHSIGSSVTHGLRKPGIFMLAAVHNGDVLAAGFTSDGKSVSPADVDILGPICNAVVPDTFGDLPWICCDSLEELVGFFRKYPTDTTK